MPDLPQETIRLLDELSIGDTIEIVYQSGDRERLAIGQYDGIGKDDFGIRTILRRGSRPILMDSVISVERVEVQKR